MTRLGRRVVARREAQSRGPAGIGVDNVDVPVATELGILVVNAPTANCSATEHTVRIAARRAPVPAADASMKSGEDRKSFLGVELQGRPWASSDSGASASVWPCGPRPSRCRCWPTTRSSTRRWRAGWTERSSFEDLLRRADVVTLHTPLTDQTRNMLDARRLALMKPGALIVNCGRGGLIDEPALLAALVSGHIAGAGLDVYSEEPPVDFALMRHPRVVATPHIGAQTREAQERISTETAHMLIAALEGSTAVTAVNLPFAPAGTRGEPYLRLGEQLGQLAGALAGGSLKRVQVDLWGVDEALRRPVSVAVLKGALTPFLGDSVNYVNAELMAASRGIEVVRATHAEAGEYSHLVGVVLEGSGGTADIAGTLFGERDARIVRFSGFRLEFRPAGKLLVLRNRDVPGVVGRIGTLLGDSGINIAEIHLARREGDENALAVLRLDQEPDAAVMKKLAALDDVVDARAIVL